MIDDKQTLIDMKVTKKSQKQFIKQKLSTNKKWAVNALLKIYDFQTNEEQNVGHTIEHNGVGFSGVDSDFLSSLAEQYLSKGYLSNGQMKYLFKLIPKYWGQILKISDEQKLNKQIVENV